MKKTLVVVITPALAVVGAFYFKKNAECFGSTGAVELPPSIELKRGRPISLHFKMLRIAAPGCFTGHSSDSYKSVSCGYRLAGAENWISGDLAVVTDTPTEYIVECRIPQLVNGETEPKTFEYYFEYSAWGGPAERQKASAVIN